MRAGEANFRGRIFGRGGSREVDERPPGSGADNSCATGRSAAAFDGFVHERDGLGAEAGFGRILGRPAPRFFRSSAAGRATVLTRYFLLKGRSSPGHVSSHSWFAVCANSFQISDFGCRAYPRGLVLPPGGGESNFFSSPAIDIILFLRKSGPSKWADSLPERDGGCRGRQGCCRSYKPNGKIVRCVRGLDGSADCARGMKLSEEQRSD